MSVPRFKKAADQLGLSPDKLKTLAGKNVAPAAAIANATDATDVITRVNAILVVLRARGIIASA